MLTTTALGGSELRVHTTGRSHSGASMTMADWIAKLDGERRAQRPGAEDAGAWQAVVTETRLDRTRSADEWSIRNRICNTQEAGT
jgi:hypothetical protein